MKMHRTTGALNARLTYLVTLMSERERERERERGRESERASIAVMISLVVYTKQNQRNHYTGLEGTCTPASENDFPP